MIEGGRICIDNTGRDQQAEEEKREREREKSGMRL